MSKTIGILSGKGGTGKTTLAINLAAALHALGENTLLVDANLTNPHVGISLGTGHYHHTVHDVLLSRASAAQSVQYHPTGLKHAPGSVIPKEDVDHTLLRQYNKLADYVLFDGPPGKHDHVLSAVEQVLIVTTPDKQALVDAHRIMHAALDQNKILVGVVVNQADSKKLSTAAIEEFLGVPVITEIPVDEKVPQALSRRTPYVHAYPKRPAAQAIRELAARIAVRPL